MPKHNNFMNYININQRAFIDFGIKSGIKVDLIDATITHWMIQFMNAPKTKKILVNGEVYTLIRYSKILNDNPLIMIKTKRAMISRINKLLGLGIIEKQVVVEDKIKATYFKLTELAYNIIVMSNELKESDITANTRAYKAKTDSVKFVKRLRGFAFKLKWSNTPLGSEARFMGVVKQDSPWVVKQDSHYRVNQFNSINYNSKKTNKKEKEGSPINSKESKEKSKVLERTLDIKFRQLISELFLKAKSKTKITSLADGTKNFEVNAIANKAYSAYSTIKDSNQSIIKNYIALEELYISNGKVNMLPRIENFLLDYELKVAELDAKQQKPWHTQQQGLKSGKNGSMGYFESQQKEIDDEYARRASESDTTDTEIIPSQGVA